MFDAVRSLFVSARRVLLISHVAPDGDAIGSLLGLYWLLRSQGVAATPANQDGVPRFLRSSQAAPGWEEVVSQAPDAAFDLVVALDCSDRPRLGSVFQPELHGHLPLVNLDHHITNLGFGTVDLVDPAATSTSEMVLRLADALGWHVSPPAAQCLLTGIVGDTLCFRTANVTPPLLATAQRLMEEGASLLHANEVLFNRSSLGSICLWGKALSSVQLDDRVIWTAIPLASRGDCYDVEQSDTGLATFLVAAEEADVAVVFSQREGGRIDVGMRARPGFDVAQVALNLGGGGHALAAGCSLWGAPEQVQRRVLSALQASLADQRRAKAAADGPLPA